MEKVLNQSVEFHDLPDDHQAAFAGKSAQKVCFLPRMQFYKFTERQLVDEEDRVTPWWSGVQPLSPADAGLVKTLERTRDLGGMTAQLFSRARSAVTWQWNAMTKLQVMELRQPVWGFVGRCASQKWNEDPELKNVRWIGGAWQAYVPYLMGEHVAAANVATLGPSWMVIAESQLGVREVKGATHNSSIVGYHASTSLNKAAHTDEVPWCSSFVNWTLLKAGYHGTNNALASSWATWGRGLATPRFGAVTVIRQKFSGTTSATGSSTGNHVGFYVSSTPGAVRLLGGNQSDQVKPSDFSTSKYSIVAYRWPT